MNALINKELAIKIEELGYKISEFSIDQLNILETIYEDGFNVDELINPEYTISKLKFGMLLINIGLDLADYRFKEVEDNITSQYADIVFNEKTLKYLMEPYNKKYTKNIKDGKAEIEKYKVIDDKISSMGINLADYDFGKLYLLRLGVEEGLDITKYSDKEFTFSQMLYIVAGLKRNLDVTCYNKPEIEEGIMSEIYSGLRRNPKMKDYVNKGLNKQQLKKIVDCFIEGVDPKQVEGLNYPSNVMKACMVIISNGGHLTDYNIEDNKEYIDFQMNFILGRNRLLEKEDFCVFVYTSEEGNKEILDFMEQFKNNKGE